MAEAQPERDAKLEIRSFRVVFQLERRLHRIQHWKLPLPYGLPLRGLAYGALVLLAIVALGRVPVLGELVRLMPPPVRFLLAPVGAGFLLARARVDGRPAHRFLLAWARHRAGARWVSAFRPIDPPRHVRAVRRADRVRARLLGAGVSPRAAEGPRAGAAALPGAGHPPRAQAGCRSELRQPAAARQGDQLRRSPGGALPMRRAAVVEQRGRAHDRRVAGRAERSALLPQAPRPGRAGRRCR